MFIIEDIAGDFKYLKIIILNILKERLKKINLKNGKENFISR